MRLIDAEALKDKMLAQAATKEEGWDRADLIDAQPVISCETCELWESFPLKWGGERWDCRDENCGEGVRSKDFGCSLYEPKEQK